MQQEAVSQATRRRGDKDMDYRAMRAPDSTITWKWLAGICISIMILGGGAWMSYVQSQISGVIVAMDATKGKMTDQAVEQATTKQKVETIDKKVDEVRKDVGDIRGDIKQLLQQQQQIINQQQQQTPRR